ncbi:hypothetical protein B0H65DRAFT_281589 [Neurospora tetraspora]|uniref:Uncharacterized protein n=1 Tax=Neurospora tetraspora TaxID=94610 RepID=A0AAE0J8S2_9PEZI|nr:hypothetical protein B0H65DRAFT_281589 [Neurospora tetraspora]
MYEARPLLAKSLEADIYSSATNLKLAGEVESWQEAVNHAIEFERRLFMQSPDKVRSPPLHHRTVLVNLIDQPQPTYENLMGQRFQQLVEQRQARAGATVLLSSYKKCKGEGSIVPAESGTEDMEHEASSRSLSFTEFPSSYGYTEAQRWPPFPDPSASFSREDLPQESASGNPAPPPSNTAPDLPSTQGSPKDDLGSTNTSTEALEPLEESASPVADSEEEEHEAESIEDKSTSGSHGSYKKDNDALKALRSLGHDATDWLHRLDDLNKQIEERQEEFDQSVGKASHPRAEGKPGSPLKELNQSLGPDSKPAARPDSPKDMTTGEPAGANNSGINVSPPPMSTEEDRQREQ